jgi:hypothetical protein
MHQYNHLVVVYHASTASLDTLQLRFVPSYWEAWTEWRLVDTRFFAGFPWKKAICKRSRLTLFRSRCYGGYSGRIGQQLAISVPAVQLLWWRENL